MKADARPPQSVKQDPRSQYPKPPFPRQTQKPPGLASKMKPRPDHGETSYKGSGRLLGRKALITGGDSGIGRAVAILFAREGADVAIGYLNEHQDAEETRRRVEAEGRRCLLVPGDIGDAAFCESAIERCVAELGRLDILVQNAGIYPWTLIEKIDSISFILDSVKRLGRTFYYTDYEDILNVLL